MTAQPDFTHLQEKDGILKEAFIDFDICAINKAKLSFYSLQMAMSIHRHPKKDVLSFHGPGSNLLIDGEQQV